METNKMDYTKENFTGYEIGTYIGREIDCWISKTKRLEYFLILYLSNILYVEILFFLCGNWLLTEKII